MARRIRAKQRQLAVKPMFSLWRQEMKADITRIQRCAGVHLYPEILDSRIPAVRTIDGYKPMWL